MLGVMKQFDSAMLTPKQVVLFRGQQAILHAPVRNITEVEEALYYKGPLSVDKQPGTVVFRYRDVKGVKN